MADFLHMGGYAFYVWTSYGIAFVALVAGIVAPLLRHRAARRRVVRAARRAGRTS